MPKVTYEPSGLPEEGTRVEMSMPSDLEPTFVDGSKTLYTRSMSACMAIATFDHGNDDQRTMTHVAGVPDNSYYRALAKIISPNTTIVAAGFQDSKWMFMNTVEKYVKEPLVRQMEDFEKPINQLEWLLL
ncbi:hypothetical protein N657DRAFT_650038 [Parathielavia appendiculata]|uniref:Uncharacterized protein n=1 Tax=Parathielavia appendiculata TaxID=2587402 RepID=A0AAN6YZP9_9PEZI|nr:hypothetical protein N657DRAFT_650038 [Parathielavia appendiculata]